MLKADRVLVPTDFSESARTAVAFGAELVRASQGCLHLLHVVDASGFGPPYIPQGGFVYPKDELETRQRLEALRQELGDIRVELAVRVGSAAEEIVAYASEQQADVICIATQGHRGIVHAVLGSTTEAVVRTAPCPVLSMHATSPAATH